MTGQVIFDSLPVLFCLAIAISFTDDAGTAALSALIAWLLFSMTQSLFITTSPTDPSTYNILFYHNVPAAVVGYNVGIQSQITSVFGGITIGLIVARIYNRFHVVRLPAVIGFFGGTRSIPILSFLMGIIMGFVFLLI